MKICRDCGGETPDRGSFCKRCGSTNLATKDEAVESRGVPAPERTGAPPAGKAFSTKVFIVVIAVLAAAGLGVGGYFLATRLFFAFATVPDVTGMEWKAAEHKIEKAGLTTEVEYARPDTGNWSKQIVVGQNPRATSSDGSDSRTRVKKGTSVTITLESEYYLQSEAAKAAMIEEFSNGRTSGMYRPGNVVVGDLDINESLDEASAWLYVRDPSPATYGPSVKMRAERNGEDWIVVSSEEIAE